MLDAQRGLVPSAMLDCGAHMLLYLAEPQTMMRIGLSHLLERFAATRTDVGFGSSCDPNYQAVAAQRREDCDVPDALGVAWPNQHHVLQSVWRSATPVYLDVHDAFVGSLRPALQRLRVRAKIARRLECGGRSFGIVCVDQTEERRRWAQDDQIYLDQFALGFLAPLMAASRSGKARCRLTAAEQAVVRLAVQGLSYKEIAATLNKSPNTVDNQLSQVRRKFGVRNQVELVRACASLSEA
jgi:DNA-binding CsgD family transcriptional regulator